MTYQIIIGLSLLVLYVVVSMVEITDIEALFKMFKKK